MNSFRADTEVAARLLGRFDDAAKGSRRWIALAAVLRLIVGLLLEIRGYQPLPIETDGGRKR